MFPRFLTLLCLLSLFQQASLAQQSGAATPDKVPDTCPVTKPATKPFVPSAPYESKAGPGFFWYGTDELWTSLPTTRTLKGLPLNWVFTPPSYSWGIYWWQRGYDRYTEPHPKLKVTGRRLDSRSPPLVARTAESSHALIRRGLIGIYHNVSREYLHRYLWQFDFLWNNRQLNDGERTIAAIQSAEGKRLMYKDPVAEREYIKTREQEKGGEQLEPF
jgi:hypothetical protein